MGQAAYSNSFRFARFTTVEYGGEIGVGRNFFVLERERLSVNIDLDQNVQEGRLCSLIKVKVEGDFDQNAYVRRLRLLREIVSGENQVDFAQRLDIDVKRWNNYERGYPLPREIAFKLRHLFDVCPGWIWFGLEGNMPTHLREKIKAAEALEKERRAAKRALDKATEKYRAVDTKRKKVIHPRPPSPKPSKS